MSIPFLASKPSGLVVHGLFRGLSHRASATRFGIAVQRSRISRSSRSIEAGKHASTTAITTSMRSRPTGTVSSTNAISGLRYFLNNESLSRTSGTTSTIIRRVRLPHSQGQGKSMSSVSNSTPSPSSLPKSSVTPSPAGNAGSAVNALGKPVSQRTALRRAFKGYLTLSKPHLSFLVFLTSMASYSLYPSSSLLTSSDLTPSTTLSAVTLLFLTMGTALCSASANTLNMLAEPHLDAKMTRTRNRPLVRGTIAPRNALVFAILTGTSGVCLLMFGTNPTVAALGFSNIVLYAGVYTPLKQRHVVNTWVGAIVGAIPPLMGWAAAAGESATTGSPLELLEHPGGWLVAALLYCWQFPHFNSLSHGIRHEYAAAGYKMLASVNPAMNGRVAVRYAFAFFPVCWALSYYGVTDWGFAVDSTVLNAWISYESVRFWRNVGEYGTGKRLFWASVWHLPALLVLAMAHKKGLWSGVWGWITGSSHVFDENEEEEYDYYEPGDKVESEGDYGEGRGEVSIAAGTAR